MTRRSMLRKGAEIMAELQQLITSLKANYIVLIENDLRYVTDPYAVIAKFCNLSEFQKVRLLASLINLNKGQTANGLEAFKIAFDQLAHDEALQESLLPDELGQYLAEIKGEAILPTQLIAAIAADMNELPVNDAFLRSGIFHLDDERYDALLNEFAQAPGVEFAYYRSKPVPAELGIFLEELKYGLHHTQSQYYLAVVDKMLGEGQEESGKSFIEVDLVELNGKHQLNSLAFLFTSQPSPNPIQPIDYKDFFMREVHKGSDELVKIIAGYLTDTSYATVFKNFESSYIEASQKAFTMALTNQQNVKHVIKKSINEGISPFESLRGWFDQIVQYNIDLLQVDKIDYYSSLTKFFDGQSLVDHTGIKEYGPDLEKLNSFELFDSNINRKGLPIFPGDIFLKDGEYYILVGQVCDLLIRDTGKRGAKIAEFLKFKVIPFGDEEQEKFTVAVDKKGKKDVLIQHFFDLNIDSYGVAAIEITSKNTYYGDFNVLDLCYYNAGGNSELIINGIESYRNVPWVTSEKYTYLEGLHGYFTANQGNLAANKALVDEEMMVFSASDLAEEDGKMVFGFKRISRLKGRFYDSLYQQLINYKARIDLNLIDQAIATTTTVDVIVKYTFIDTKETVNVVLTRLKPHKSFVLATDVADKVTDLFQAAVNNYSTFIEGNKSKEYAFTSSEAGYLLELPVQYTDKDNKLKSADGENLRFVRLFKETLENKAVEFLDNNEKSELNDNGEISLLGIRRGIKLIQNNISLVFKDGRVQKIANNN